MLSWELKKIFKSKNSIIVAFLMVLLFIQVGFVKPTLETENEYYDEVKDKYIVDNRAKDVIAQEKLNNKVNELKESASKIEKQLSILSKSKLDKDNGAKYEDISFYQVFKERVTFPLATLLIVAMIVTLSSNIYTDEKLSNIDSIIMSSKNKNKVLKSKLLISILNPIIIYGLYILVAFIVTYIQYGAPNNGGLQAYRIYSVASLVREMSIVKYLLSSVFVIGLVFIATSIFSALFSFISSNSIQSVSSITLFMASGKIIALMKFLPSKLIFIISQCNFIDILLGQSFIPSTYIGDISLLSMNIDLGMLCIWILVSIILIGILLNFYVFRKVLSR